VRRMHCLLQAKVGGKRGKKEGRGETSLHLTHLLRREKEKDKKTRKKKHEATITIGEKEKGKKKKNRKIAPNSYWRTGGEGGRGGEGGGFGGG